MPLGSEAKSIENRRSGRRSTAGFPTEKATSLGPWSQRRICDAALKVRLYHFGLWWVHLDPEGSFPIRRLQSRRTLSDTQRWVERSL